jgi:ankyrin repeat protein
MSICYIFPRVSNVTINKILREELAGNLVQNGVHDKFTTSQETIFFYVLTRVMASAEDKNDLLSNSEPNDPACFLPEGSESLFQYIQEDLKNDPNSDPEELTEDNYTEKVFLKAAEKGKINYVAQILEKDTSLINCKDSDGYSALHRASYNGHVEMVKVLLNGGADIGSLTENNWQPLHCACRWGE